MAALGLTMSHISIANLFSDLKKSTDEQTALTISKAFEAIVQEQDNKIVRNREEVIKEMMIQDFATKKDLLLVKEEIRSEVKSQVNALRTEMHTLISSAKWQVIGSVAVLIFLGMFARHLGIN